MNGFDDIPAGIYIIKIWTDNGNIITQKLIKN
ncbi:T9SS type A sorting domain-containing protein [Parasegetibacter sp. MAH-26]|uniref:T9SS type A sorting domain-containing protein n=1 Tax=Pinibacter aurantiacus TaxID=2851599 RepID=A0A9E2S6G2_9BACT|nr:T9SS type A sorting domain-containing protein [Pinibacter aurantiacus]